MISSFQQGLNTLYQRLDLSQTTSAQLFSDVLQGKCAPAQVAAMLVALKIKGESVPELAGAAMAMRENAMDFPAIDGDYISDCCGTGGDGFNTINASTLTSIVASGMGLNMVKHGNRSVSSSYGSADLMQDLGINLDLTPEQNHQLLARADWAFLFAPHYHKGMKHVMPVRNELKTRTIFNLIGPLSNPAYPDRQLLGVYDARFCEPFAHILNALGTKRALVVHGGGLDEITVHAETHVAELNNGVVTSYRISPNDLGIAQHALSAIQMADGNANLPAAKAVLTGTAPDAHVDMVAANTGALLYLNEKSESLGEGVKLAKDAIRNGKGQQQLDKIIATTKAIGAS